MPLRGTSCNVIQCLNSIQMAEDVCTNEVRYPFDIPLRGTPVVMSFIYRRLKMAVLVR